MNRHVVPRYQPKMGRGGLAHREFGYGALILECGGPSHRNRHLLGERYRRFREPIALLRRLCRQDLEMGRDLVAIDVATSLAFERQSYGTTQAGLITTCSPPPVPPPGSVCASTLPAAGSFSGSNFSPFWVAGVGVETQIWDRWTGRIEYLYLQSGSISNTFAVSGGTLAVTKSVYDNVIRTGLNYHF
jgi:hypothetical protein